MKIYELNDKEVQGELHSISQLCKVKVEIDKKKYRSF